MSYNITTYLVGPKKLNIELIYQLVQKSLTKLGTFSFWNMANHLVINMDFKVPEFNYY